MKSGWANGLAAAGLLAGSVWWLGTVPYRPERLLIPVPAEASFISSHSNLAARWDRLRENDVTRGVLELLVGDEGDLAALSADPEFRTQLKRFGSGEFVAGFVPDVGPARADAVYFISWLSGRSHWLRWMLSFSSGDLVRQDLPHGRMYWVTDTEMKDARGRDMRFALLFEEGIGIGCLSADPHNIQLAVACHDRMLPSVVDRGTDVASWVLGPVGADRGWVAPRAGGEPGLLPLEYAVTSVEPDRVKATVRLEGAWRAVDEPAAGAGHAVDFPWRAAAYASAAASRDVTAALLRTVPDAAWERDLSGLLADVGGSGCAVGLFGGELGGRLRGLRVPALALSIPCEDEAAALVSMNRLVHRVGIREELALVTREAPGSEPPIYTITSAGRSLYAGLPDAERAAFAAVDGRLVIASNLRTLRGLLALPVSGEAAPVGGGPLWLEMDLARGGKSVRNALAAYSLVRMFEGGSESEDAVARLSAVRGWMEQVSDLGFLRAGTRTDDQAMIIDLEVGP